MEKLFAAVGAACVVIVAIGLVIAAIVFASHPPAPVNVYFDGEPVPSIQPTPYQPTPYRPTPAPYPYRPGNSGSKDVGEKEAAGK